MTNLDFHPSAKERFNQLGSELLPHLRKWQEDSSKEESYEPETAPAAHFSDQNAEISYLGHTTGPLDTKITGRRFKSDSEVFELSETGCEKLESLLQKLLQQKSLRNSVSRKTVYIGATNWIEESVQHGQRTDFIDSLVCFLSEKMEEREIWVPVAFLHVQSDLSFGEVTFRPFSVALIDKWISQLLENVPEDRKSMARQEAEKRRQKYQGLAAAALSVYAEPSKASEAALRIAEDAVSLLRVYCPENMEPLAVSYCKPLGQELVESFTTFTMADESIASFHRETLPPHPSPWKLSDESVNELMKIGLGPLAELAGKANLTEFEIALKDSLNLYGRSSTSRTVAEKLVFILVALESLLLRDASESIQQNIGERMAFIVASSKEERRSVVKLFKECYGIRSRYIHHGETPRDLERLRAFMLHSWSLFNGLIKNRDRFTKRSDLFEYIEDLKYS